MRRATLIRGTALQLLAGYFMHGTICREFIELRGVHLLRRLRCQVVESLVPWLINWFVVLWRQLVDFFALHFLALHFNGRLVSIGCPLFPFPQEEHGCNRQERQDDYRNGDPDTYLRSCGYTATARRALASSRSRSRRRGSR